MDSVSAANLDISIGQVPLSLQISDERLFENAVHRYKHFLMAGVDAVPVVLRRAGECPSEWNGESFAQFTYDWNSSSLRFLGSSAEFRGVRHEYDLDSLIRILLSVMLVPRRGFLLHAAAVVREDHAYVFTGRSGAGKSTVASFSPAGSVLTDEISLLRMIDGAWHAYGTPFWGEFRAEGANTHFPIAGIYTLVKATQDRVERIPAGEAVRSMLPNVLFFSRDKEMTASLLRLVGEFADQVPCYRLYFRRQESFWEAITECTKTAGN